MNVRPRRPPTPCIRALSAGALTLLLMSAPRPVFAQTFVPDPVEQTRLIVQVEKPFLEGVLGLAAYSSILEADGVFPLGSGSVQIGLPLAVAGADVVDGTSLYMGNLRATFLFGPPGRLTSFIGVTLPTASNIGGPNLAVLVGALPWLGELEKWIDDAFSVSAAAVPAWPLGASGQMGLRLGGVAIMPTGLDNLNVDLRVAGWVRAPAGSAELKAELATTYMVTSDDGFGRQFTAYLDLGAAWDQAARRPMLFLRLPLDDEGRQVHDFSLGIALAF